MNISFLQFTVGMFTSVSTVVAEDLEPTTIPSESSIVRDLKESTDSIIKLDDQGRAISLTWGFGSDQPFTDQHLKQVAKLKHLKELWLECSDVTDEGVVEIKSMRQLEILGLICEPRYKKPANLTDAALKHLRCLTNLKTLRLDDSDVTNCGLNQLRPLKKLEELDLSGTEVSDAGLIHLRHFNKLKLLDLSETQFETQRKAITYEAILRLQPCLPDCEILH